MPFLKVFSLQFQFQYGAIKGCAKQAQIPRQEQGFNSSMVRLKAAISGAGR